MLYPQPSWEVPSDGSQAMPAGLEQGVIPLPLGSMRGNSVGTVNVRVDLESVCIETLHFQHAAPTETRKVIQYDHPSGGRYDIRMFVRFRAQTGDVARALYKSSEMTSSNPVVSHESALLPDGWESSPYVSRTDESGTYVIVGPDATESFDDRRPSDNSYHDLDDAYLNDVREPYVLVYIGYVRKTTNGDEMVRLQFPFKVRVTYSSAV